MSSGRTAGRTAAAGPDLNDSGASTPPFRNFGRRFDQPRRGDESTICSAVRLRSRVEPPAGSTHVIRNQIPAGRRALEFNLIKITFRTGYKDPTHPMHHGAINRRLSRSGWINRTVGAKGGKEVCVHTRCGACQGQREGRAWMVRQKTATRLCRSWCCR
jgi:hypothetical protein